MFDAFKRPKRIKAVIETVYPIIYLYCHDEGGNMYENLYNDKHALAYFYGMATFRIVTLGKISTTETGLIMLGAFDALFYGNGRNVLEYCNKFIEDGDESFKHTVFLGFSEIKKIYNILDQGVDVCKLELSIIDYLKDKYINPRDESNNICDFLEQPQSLLPPSLQQAGKAYRNSPCPCGSGKQYKKCCGK